jgi:arginyl-tRNA synthetase
MERFAKTAAELLSQVLTHPVQTQDLEIPPDRSHGDFAFPCFKLAKEQRAAPPQIAQKLAAELKAKNSSLEVVAVGPYVNFKVPADKAVSALLKDILAGSGNGSYGRLPAKSRETWVIEYSSPNVAKPFQIYHVRPTALGAALDRIGRYRGFRVVSINHLGD